MSAVTVTLRLAREASIPIVMRAPEHPITDIVRRYTPQDRSGCLAVFDGNVPTYFNMAERDDFTGFLDSDAVACSYQVVERYGRIVACGGFAVDANSFSAGLCWGMVANGLHNMGLGSVLTAARLKSARNTPGVEQVRLDTSQHTQGFYRRSGFVVEGIVPDGYGPGLDRWDMLLRL
ncbi:GNAT family N-acetyltransferase [Sphingomonas sp. PL-96]|uniref:GNAT family N-acetyltransferase n=1 Tax=Sphingomonas sp. PL-96 TaxID=2887201 RepID=UPI001E465FF4|nr:GNAT family N-acetyltransferase [Sphingomonas sp. PL-96]MCC2976661.1 GNAT family N-acetyltransferase [Sphingomonas sp. PL-96]